MGKLGIEKLSQAIIAVITLGEKIEDKFDDGKLTGAEALQVAVGSFGSVVKLVKSAGQIKAEVLDLDEAEKAELVELVKVELDLDNDKIEAAIEAAVEFLLKLDTLILAIKG
jgi:hypothetical protein